MIGRQQPERTHFTDLDGLRGLLACLVMLMHYGLNGLVSAASGGVLARGAWDLSVDVFFILSGFVLARSFLLRPPTLRGYLAKRVLRLAPLFLLTLGAAIAAGMRADAATMLANLLMVQPFLGLDSLNFPAWSIPFEMVLPALGLVGLRRWPGGRTGAVLLLALIVGGSLCATLLARGIDLRPARACFGLGTGMALYRVSGPWLGRLRGSPGTVLGLFAAILLVMLVGVRVPQAALAVYPLACAAIVTGAEGRSLLSRAPCQALGRWSYAIYLWHIPVLLLAERVLGADALSHNLPGKLALAAVTVALSAATHRFVERPLMRPRPYSRDRAA